MNFAGSVVDQNGALTKQIETNDCVDLHTEGFLKERQVFHQYGQMVSAQRAKLQGGYDGFPTWYASSYHRHVDGPLLQMKPVSQVLVYDSGTCPGVHQEIQTF